ncbi:MAG: 3'-5' exonuclease, partial [Bacteriovoracaceae bacterium]
KGVAAFDLEMTGLTAVVDKIIEIAAVKVDSDGKVSTFHELVNPLIEIPERTIQYHNITNDMVRDRPTLKKPLENFQSFYGSLPLIAHNAQFDASFIVKGLHEHNLSFSLSDIYDSCKMARAVFKNRQKIQKPNHEKPCPENFRLATLAKFYNMNFNHHQALDDAIISLKIMSRCMGELQLQDALKPSKVKEMSFLYKLNSFQKREAYILPKKQQALAEHATNKTELEIMYQGGSFKNSFRQVLPVAILPMPQGLALYAQCLKSNTFKYFKLKKIKEYKKADNDRPEC